MFILDQVFKLREKVQISRPDEEKPFLQHLDDLRTMLMRLVLTLLVSTLVCFVYAPELMDIMRKPADQVWEMYEESHLTNDITPEEWGNAKSLAYTLPGLDEKGKNAVYSRISERERELVESALILRTARQFPKEQRADLIAESGLSPSVTQLALQLEERDAVLTEDSGRGALKLMGAFKPSEPFMMSMKLAFYAGIVVSSPFLLYFILQFIVPGLLENERRMLYKSMAYGVGLFLVGVLFAYFVVLPRVLTFFYEYSLDFGIANEWRIGYYLSFATQLVLLFGLSFELPILVYPFIRLGVLTYELMATTRRYAIVCICILAAVITPTPDAFTMMLMAVPMYALYEFCIILARKEGKRRQREEEEARREANAAYGLPDEG